MRARRCGETIDRAVCEAAGLEAHLPEAWAEILRLVDRMADAAERRDLGLPPPSGAGALFPPLRRYVRPMRPERAGKLWLAKLHELTAAAGTSEGEEDRVGETAADTGSLPETAGSVEAAP